MEGNKGVEGVSKWWQVRQGVDREKKMLKADRIQEWGREVKSSLSH